MVSELAFRLEEAIGPAFVSGMSSGWIPKATPDLHLLLKFVSDGSRVNRD